jgi:hypothetical protein
MASLAFALRPALACLALVLSIPTPGSRRQEPELKVQIGLLQYGDAHMNKCWQDGLWRSRDGKLPVVVTNVSDRTLDLFTDGNSWGDRTLTIILTVPGRKPIKITNSTSAYYGNSPGIVRLRPGQVWVRAIAYGKGPWNDLQKALATAGPSVQVQAVLEQTEDLAFKQDPNIWIGKAESETVTVPIN